MTVKLRRVTEWMYVFQEEEDGAALGDVDPTERFAVSNEQRILGLSAEPLPMAWTP